MFGGTPLQELATPTDDDDGDQSGFPLEGEEEETDDVMLDGICFAALGATEGDGQLHDNLSVILRPITYTGHTMGGRHTTTRN